VLDVPFEEVDAVMESIRRGHNVRFRQRMTVLGANVDLGMAEFKMPSAPLVLTEKGMKPGQVKLRLKSSEERIEFRLVEEPSEPPVISELLWTPGRGRG
jgi:hypothetical protein